MIQYVLELLVFQLAFLLVYDLFLKKETFFQWNRAYLLVTFLLSLVLPWIKLETLKTTVTSTYAIALQSFFQLEGVTLEPLTETTSFWSLLTWYEWVFIFGVLVAILIFSVKLYNIQRLKYCGKKEYYNSFTKVIVTQSELAFSFFKHVFLGDEIPKEKEANILAHELVHIKQWHSLDLLFFELMRIVFWFNPLVYVYQSRMSELHEFIADANVAKTNKKEQYQWLLSEAFQTQNISFINQFFKSSLIKKRIVMLNKKKSSKENQLKYVLLLPLVLTMLVYSACETEKLETYEFSSNVTETENVLTLAVYDINNLTQEEEEEQTRVFAYIEEEGKTITLKIEDNFKNSMEIYYSDGVIDNMHVFKKSNENVVPFGVIDEVPVFPGCEDALDKKACFLEKIQTHIRKHFNYPLEAQDLGIEGRVSVMFTIDEKGEIFNIQKRGPHRLLEDEVERIIMRLPKMEPGSSNGKVVKVPFSIPINFVLNE